ncbi:MAG: AMP-binding protein [Alphaproteobacteria bacterium]|nr:AMP-binding protein [Alphaproteobacteria bacterium]
MNTVLTLHDPATARRYYEQGLWRPDTFYSLMRGHAEARPDAWAMRDGARRITWRELLAWTDALAADLHGAGVVQGQRVSLWTSNRIESVIGLLASARNGYVCNPSLHLNYTGEEITALLQRIRAAALIAEEGYGAASPAVLDGIAVLSAMKRVLRLPKGRVSGPGFPKAGDGIPPPADGNPDRVCYLAFTSGTTGTPKGVLHSHNTLLANARDLVKDWGHDTSTVLLSLSPVSHHIFWVALSQVLVAGGELVLNDPPAGMKPLDWIVEAGATYVMGVPTHGMDILADQRSRGLERIGNVRVFYMAGAPIPPVTAEAFLKQGIKPQNVYGMTENSSHQYTYPGDDPQTICGTCGRGGGGYAVRLFAQDNRDVEVPIGEVGQIGGKGACLMLGYFDNQQATEEPFNKDGWFLSGDLGRMDSQGNLAIVGRMKDIIIRGGHNIHPAKIEDLAIKHPLVAKAAAFPVPDERLGEKVGLAVMPLASNAPAGEAMLEHLHAAGLSKFDMPEYYIVMDAFPLTASGKILKRELADWARTGRIRPAPVRFSDPQKRKEA